MNSNIKNNTLFIFCLTLLLFSRTLNSKASTTAEQYFKDQQWQQAAEEYQMALENIKPCNTENHRAFDLWLGEWAVTTPSRENWKAESSITFANGGCSIHERYLSQSGYSGNSINFYDKEKKLWHQSWMDNSVAAIYLEGTPKEGAMILSDSTNKVTWSLLDDKRVRQHWQTTTDAGKTWTTAFGGYYLKK